MGGDHLPECAQQECLGGRESLEFCCEPLLGGLSAPPPNPMRTSPADAVAQGDCMWRKKR